MQFGYLKTTVIPNFIGSKMPVKETRMIKSEFKKFFSDNKTKLYVVLALIIVWIGSFIACWIVDVQAEKKNAPEEYINPTTLVEGSGTESDPYLISSKEDLLVFNNNVAEFCNVGADFAYTALTCDIDLGGMDWSPIGSVESGIFYCGVFDGRGYTISNFTISDNEDCDDLGFFSATWYIEDSVTEISNLNLANVQIVAMEDYNYIGGLVGSSYAKITNCNVEAYITAYGNVRSAGGVVGSLNGNISNCTSSGSMNMSVQEYSETGTSGVITYTKFGGVVGIVQEGAEANNLTNNMALNFSLVQNSGSQTSTISCTIGGVIGQIISIGGEFDNLINNADINGVGSVGGVLGDFWSNGAILSNCINSGNIYSTSGVSLNVGGVVAFSCRELSNTILNCGNSGELEAKMLNYTGISLTAWGGGVLGLGSATVLNCKSTGDINFYGETTAYVGGLVGGNNGTVKNSYCIGDITVESSAGLIVGGLVGIMQDNLGVVLESCYYAGVVQARMVGVDTTEVTVAGIVGYNMRTSGTTIKNNYYDITIIENADNTLYTTPTEWYYDKEETVEKYEGETISGNAGIDTQTMQSGNLSGFVAYQQDSTDSNAVWIFENGSYPKLYWE